METPRPDSAEGRTSTWRKIAGGAGKVLKLVTTPDSHYREKLEAEREEQKRLNILLDKAGKTMNDDPGALGALARAHTTLQRHKRYEHGEVSLVHVDENTGELSRNDDQLLNGPRQSPLPGLEGANPLFAEGESRVTQVALSRATTHNPETGKTHEELELAVGYRTVLDGKEAELADRIRFTPGRYVGEWDVEATRERFTVPGAGQAYGRQVFEANPETLAHFAQQIQGAVNALPPSR